MPEVLPSWNEGPSKHAIVDFVTRITDEGSPDFVPLNQRIAVFDNDGTLWCEQPMPFQLFYALHAAKEKASNEPELAKKEPFASVLSGDIKAVKEQGMDAILEIVKATHTGMTIKEFEEAVLDWMETARHPTLDRPFTELVYQPMLEVLSYLRANGFMTFIVSGGTVEFMRAFAEKTYGIPPPQVIGSTFKTRFDTRDGSPVVILDPDIELFNDKAAKPVAIAKYIGRQPIACFGNSDGDREMLQWTTRGVGTDAPLRFGVIVHHTDATREFAYDRDAGISSLNTALDEAEEYGWVLVDMKNDWKTIFPAADAARKSASQ